MTKDPVCGNKVNEKSPGATTSFKGEVFYFCCPPCKEEFLKSPERYIDKQGSETIGGCC